MTLTITHFLVLSALLLVAGLLTMVLKRNAIGMLMGVELILNAAALNLTAFNAFAPAASGGGSGPRLEGQIFTLFIIVIAAAEAAIALAIFLNFYNNFTSIDVERGTTLKG
ncbi:MAG TPA: NADH-quinone oxidoreductase subunit NuoK [Phycisphaerae bacterium]|nr:NADH-quinone oxidoreductase subunit NuoK [Phycisphaerae bacterium]